MPDLDIYLPDIKTALVEELGDSITQEISMFLGDPVSGEWKANTSATEVYVHSAGSDGRVVQRARNRLYGVALEYGLPVVVQKRNTRLTVTGVDEALTPAFYEAQQARPPISVGIDQIQYGTLQQTNPPSMQVWVTAFSYIYNGQEKRWPGGLTANFSSSPLDSSSSAINIPTTANKAIAVLVQVDGATNTLSYVQSGIYPGYAKLKEDWDNLRPACDDDALICGYIVLNTGVTQLLNQTNIINSPPWQTAGNGTFANLTDTPSSYAAGDIFYHNGTSIVKLPKGTIGQVLTQDTSAPAWDDAAGGSGGGVNGGCYVTSSITTASASESGYMTFSEEWDNGGYFSSGDTITVPSGKQGYYIINGVITYSSNSSSYDSLNLEIETSGGTLEVIYITTPSFVGSRSFSFTTNEISADGTIQAYYSINGNSSGSDLNIKLMAILVNSTA